MDNIEVNEKIISRLRKKVLKEVNENIRTNNIATHKMVDNIKSWIEEEVRCYLNQ